MHKTGKGETFITDDEDDKYIHGYTWNYQGGKNKSIGRRISKNNKAKTIYLGRFLLEIEKENPYKVLVMHKNKDKTDFRKQNLEIVDKTTIISRQTNSKSVHVKKSKFKGVHLQEFVKSYKTGKIYKRKNNIYQVQICIKGEIKHIGCYQTEEEAAKAYNEAAKKYFGKYSHLNEV